LGSTYGMPVEEETNAMGGIAPHHAQELHRTFY